MSDNSSSADLTLPEDWGYSPRINALVSLPLRKTTEKKIVRRNGDIQVTFTAFGDMMPYGKLPRMLDAIVATMILTNDESWDAEKRRWHIGRSFYEFAEHKLGITRGGSQYKRLRDQLNYWIRTAYTIENKGVEDIDTGTQFLVAEGWHVPWVDMDEWNRHPEDKECWLQFSELYIEKVIRENPVPVSFQILRELNQIKSPLSIDLYLWLNRRMSYLNVPSKVIAWNILREQFGSEAKDMGNFKRTFKEALQHVQKAWPQLKIEVSDRKGVILFPSLTAIRTAGQNRAIEQKRRANEKAAKKNELEGKWYPIYGTPNQVYWCSEAFNLNKALAHLEGSVSPEECPVCAFNECNHELHNSRSAGSTL